MVLQYLTYNEIDKQRWDACIDNSVNGLIYAKSVVLDCFCTNWHAIVIDNYEAVFPIPWRKKYGIRYVYMPLFIQRLGLFYTAEKYADMLEACIIEMKKHFSFADFSVSIINEVSIPGLYTNKRANYLIKIGKNYTETVAGWTPELKKNIHKAISRGLGYKKNFDIEQLISAYKFLSHDKGFSIPEKDFNSLREFLHRSPHQIILRCVENKENNLIASAAFLKGNHRLFYIMGAIHHTAPKNSKATEFLLTEIVKEFSEEMEYLDLMGSDIEGVENFYKKFNPVNEAYLSLYYNNLPWPLKYFKKNRSMPN